MAGLNYSPRLKAAMEEINVVLNNYDIAGLVFLYHDHKGDYLAKVNTTKSVMEINGQELRFRSKLADFDGDVEAKRKADEYSVGMIRIFLDMMHYMLDNLTPLYAHLNEALEIEHSGPIHTPHTHNNEG